MSRFANFFRRVGMHRGHATHDLRPGPSDVADVEFRIPNMVCEGCAEKIDAVLLTIPGVCEIQPNVSQKRIRVRYEPTRVDPKRLRAGLAAAGFTALDAEWS